MAKDNNNSESTTISSRIDIPAKNIIKRSNKSYRQILEKEAYSSINGDLNDLMFTPDEKLEEMKEDLSDLKRSLEDNKKDIEYFKKYINTLETRNESLTEKINEKEKRITEIKEAKEYLINIRDEYSDQIHYGIADAASEVENVLKHNAELRKKGPRARVKESEIKQICKKYKVSMDEVIDKVDSQYLDCLENYEKYI